jgi:hypothetical protein
VSWKFVHARKKWAKIKRWRITKMRLKSIALLVVAMLLVAGSASAMAIAGAEDESGDYWWEDPYWWEDTFEEDHLTPDERRLVIEMIKLIFNRYFGIDVSRMIGEELGKLGIYLGPEGQEKYARLAKEYGQRKGLEIPEDQGYEPGAAPPVEDVYWWEIVGNPEGKVEWIKDQIAQAKGMTPGEVEERFGELFPGVDLWRMTFYEFHNFVNSLPRPPIRPVVCFDELRRNPYIIAVFGRVPAFATEGELREFEEKLEQVVDKAWPLLQKLPRCKFPPAGIVVSQGAISIAVYSDQLPRAEEVYQIIAEKAERLFGIEDVPVTFSVCRGGLLVGGLSSPASSGWRPPFNEPFHPIPGAVKVTSPWVASTASFTIRRFTGAPDPWDEDYIVSGHKGPGLNITPLNTHINQPTAHHPAGRVMDNADTRAHADAARVGISDDRVRPYILIGGTASNPALRPVVASGDPAVNTTIWISAGRSGITRQVNVVRYETLTTAHAVPFERLYHQVLVRPVQVPGEPEWWGIPGDTLAVRFGVHQ